MAFLGERLLSPARGDQLALGHPTAAAASRAQQQVGKRFLETLQEGILGEWKWSSHACLSRLFGWFGGAFVSSLTLRLHLWGYLGAQHPAALTLGSPALDGFRRCECASAKGSNRMKHTHRCVLSTFDSKFVETINKI